MDPTPSFHRRFPSNSDRLLGAFNFSPPSSITTSAGDELNEAELFWSSDSSESENQNQNQRPAPQPTELTRHRSFDLSQDSGILAVLSGPDNRDSPVFRGKSPVSSSRMIPSFPRPRPSSGYNSEQLVQSMPARKFQQSAPVKVPVLPPSQFSRRRNVDALAVLDDDDDDGEELLPPHELVARGSGVSPRTTFSVLEGVGRTLKGRDLRQVRNAVLRQTGFLD
ncbi:unnamed protein product [Vicia faba]|uniref:Senescence regulator n=1 Tax=Vicia faba TaxID=3906 RepID=A0AAV1AX86_VICFA|nr:unnamed protein product [Vicia faba]